jgi:hypothetical protein
MRALTSAGFPHLDITQFYCISTMSKVLSDDFRVPAPRRRKKKTITTLRDCHLDSYDYEQLPSDDSLRILELQPGAGNDRIEVHLETVHDTALADRIQHVYALSYVWGDPARTKSITCNRKAFKITASLHSALRAIRLPDHVIQVWADAVSINQENPLERNHQIRMMTRIYSKAKSVLVWLGPDPDGIGKRAFQFARRVASDASFVGDVIKYWWAFREEIGHLRSTSQRDWFKRMWSKFPRVECV